jgi:hypothetical protein
MTENVKALLALGKWPKASTRPRLVSFAEEA